MSVITRIAAIAALLLASACSGQPEVLEPDPTASTTPTSSLGPPTMPDEAREDSESGAATFAYYWVSVSDFASLTGNVEELSRISAESCGACSEYIELYEETYRKGGKFTGGQQDFGEVTTERVSDREVVVRAKVTLAKGTYQDSRESAAKDVAGSTTKVAYRVARVGSTWLMKEFAVDE